MVQIHFAPPISIPVCAPPQIQPHGRPQHRAVEAWRAARHLRFRAKARLYKTMNILCDTFRSLFGHIRLQSARGWIVSYGPAFQQDQSGCLLTNTRTVARAEYTEKLAATHRWVDSVDLKMFLAGFDAGEQWAQRSRDIEKSADAQFLSHHTSEHRA